jgi:hypothetical protein
MVNIFVQRVLQKGKIKRNKSKWDAQNFDIVRMATKIDGRRKAKRKIKG